MCRGIHGIQDEVFLSVPAALGECGVTKIVIQPLNEEEHASLSKSAKLMVDIQKGLSI